MIYYKDGVKMMRPVHSREEYLQLRNGGEQQQTLKAVRSGDESRKSQLVQMNYSCLPNDDGTLKGSKRMSTTVGMDIDHLTAEEMPVVRERILSKKDELGLRMLEESARGAGYHLVFRRRPELSQEENLKWASDLLEVEYDKGAKDITRVFFTTTEKELLYLDDAIFEVTISSPKIGEARRGLNDGTSAAETVNVHTTPTPPNLGGENKCFKGIPYTSIISEWWRRNGGEPAEGERNVKLHKLAVNLRAICDNKKEVLMQVMPRFGLSDVELKSVVDSACKEEPKGVSKVMQGIIDALELGINPDEIEDAEAVAEETGVKVNVKALPIGLKESLVGVPVSMHMPVLCGIMPIAAAYADQVTVEYCDGNTHRLGLMSIIRGEQASNKSVVKNAVDIWKHQLDEEDALARKREEEWKERKKGRKANEKAPEDPHVLIRVVPVTVSCSTLLKRFKNAQGHTLYSFGEELDTLRKTNGAGSWSSKYDIYRLSFDYGEWGQDYNSDQAESGVVNVAYNWTMLGTNGAMRKCFKSDNIENGLSSRVLVAEMPDSSFAKMPKFRHRSAEDEARIQQAVTRLRSFSGLVDTPRLRKAIEAWCEEKRVETAKDIDHVKDTYRKRAAVIGFRCGVIHHLLSINQTTPTPPNSGGEIKCTTNSSTKLGETKYTTPTPPNSGGEAATGVTNSSPKIGEARRGLNRESKATIDFALMMAEYCLSQQTKAFGEALESQFVDARDECIRYGSNHSIFDQLSPAFTMDDLRALKRGFCSEAGLRKIISRWYRDKWIEKTDKTHWKKLNATL